MTERLVVRVTLRGEPEQSAARANHAPLSQPVRQWKSPWKGPWKGSWIVGGAVAAGVSIILAASLLMDFSGDRSIQDDVASAEARSSAPTDDAGPVESGETPTAETATFKVEPAARPTNKRESVSAAAVRRIPAETGGGNDAKMPVQPAVAARKPIAKPKSAVPLGRVASDPPEAADAPPAKPKVAAVAPSARSGQRVAADEPKPAVAPTITDSRVLRAQLSAGIKGKEPTARLQPPIRVSGHTDRTIYYFSEVKNLDGQTLFHHWERDGRVLATIPFKIRGQRWRVYSRKTITPQMTGRWRVVLADSSGKELANSAFHVR